MRWYDVILWNRYLLRIHTDAPSQQNTIALDAFQILYGTGYERIWVYCPGAKLTGTWTSSVEDDVKSITIKPTGAVTIHFLLSMPLNPMSADIEHKIDLTLKLSDPDAAPDENTLSVKGGVSANGTLRAILDLSLIDAGKLTEKQAPALFERSKLFPSGSIASLGACDRFLSFQRVESSMVYVFSLDIKCDGLLNPPLGVKGLWPLGLLPWTGVSDEVEYDFRVRQALDPKQVDGPPPSPEWILTTRSSTRAGVGKHASPAAADGRRLINRIFSSLPDTLGGDPASALPRFTIPDKEVAPPEQAWEQRYRVSTIEKSARYRLSLEAISLVEGFTSPCTLGCLRSHADEPITRTLAFENNSLALHSPTLSLMIKDESSADGGVPLRVGAMDLTLGSADDQLTGGVLNLTVHGVDDSESSLTPTYDVSVNKLRFAIAEACPGDQDPTPADRYDARAQRSIIVPTTPMVDAIQLVVSERWSKNGAHRLAMQLERSSPATQSLQIVVLDQRPFLVARVDVAFAGTEIADWSTDANEGSSWLLPDDVRRPALTQLPPQILGEDMVKDYAKQEPGPLRYRFSPPALLTLSRSVLQQRFTDAPWNLRRLLGYPGQRLPGAALESLRFELLYGLEGTLKTSRLRMASLDARIGLIPGSVLDDTTHRVDGTLLDYDNAYDEHLAVVDSRLAVLQPCSELEPEKPLDAVTGVDYSLRLGRGTADPISGDGKANDVRGGVVWGFESKNVYDQVVHSPQSTSGELRAPWFSALGGGGWQRAVFLDGLSTILSDAFMGRTTFYSVERIGRIGVLWNVAKHVIVYERTVMDSEQFPDESKAWRGEPVVRKVREYVQVMQKSRAFPDGGDRGSSGATARGFVLGSMFSGEQIPVDSAWGYDVPGGWVVPLHNPGAGHYYKRPTIALELATSDAHAGNRAHVSLLNPDTLVFYTSTSDGANSNTDEWSAVPGVDFPFEQLPIVDDESDKPPTSPPLAGAPPEPKLADASAHARGWETFTYLLDSASRTVNITAGRVDHVTEVALDNVSLARRKLLKGAATLDAALQSYKEALTRSATFVKDAATAWHSVEPLAVPTFTGNTPKDWPSTVTQLAAGVFPDADELQAGFTSTVAGRLARVQDAIATRITALVPEPIPLPALIEILEQETLPLRSTESVIGTLYADLQRVSAHLSQAGSARPRLRALVEQARATLTAAASDSLASYRVALVREVSALYEAVLDDRRLVGDVAASAFASIPTGAARVISDGLSAFDAGDVTAYIEKHWKIDSSWIELNYDKMVSDLGDLDALAGKLNEVSDALNEFAQRGLIDIAGKVDAANPVASLAAQLGDEFGKLRDKLEPLLDWKPFQSLIDGAWVDSSKIASELTDAANQATSLLAPLVELSKLTDANVKKSIRTLGGTALELLRAQVSVYEKQFAKVVRGKQAEQAKDAVALGDSTLRLVRAFGDAPVAESMKLTRDKLAYYFHQIDPTDASKYVLRKVVDFTPSTVLFNRLENDLAEGALKAVSVSLPTTSLAEKFLADVHDTIRLGKLLPSFAGLDLSALLPDLQIPKASAVDGVTLTHGLNPATRRAWAQCEVKLDLPSEVSIFQLGPVELRLVSGHLDAMTLVDVGTAGTPNRTVTGSISGNWQLRASGQPVVTLKGTALRLDSSGHLSFELGQGGIELASALQFLTDLMQAAMPSSKGGPTFELIIDGGIPRGIRALFSLSMPAIQTGAFSVSNLALVTSLGLSLRDGTFNIDAGVGLSTKDRPFNLSVLFLGGGGWITVTAVYPVGGTGDAQLSIGLAAGASAPFDIGIASGAVSLLLSIGIDWQLGGADPGLAIVLRIALSGELNILGLISVSVLLALEAHYASGSLACTGTLRVKIKIGWIISIDVEKDFTMTLSAGHASTRTRLRLATFSTPPATATRNDDTIADEAAQAYCLALGGL